MAFLPIRQVNINKLKKDEQKDPSIATHHNIPERSSETDQVKKCVRRNY